MARLRQDILINEKSLK